jgi:ubiquinone biosynthesis UbiH/UbiF/VisC/COQ6 family hydroxylase
MNRRRIDVDIAIVGAGPVGQAMALAAARTGCTVTLIDAAANAPVLASMPDLRVFALSPATTGLLSALAAWPPPHAERVCAYRRMRVWERDPDRGLVFDAAALGWSQLGSIVEHSVLQDALALAVARESLACRWSSRIATLDFDENGVSLGFEAGDDLRARLVIGADGAASPVRRLAGIDSKVVDYRQRGLVANVRTAAAHAQTAWQRFLPTGPLAFLPLADGACSIVWSVPETEAARLEQLPADRFGRELAAAAGGVLGAIELESARASFPLKRQLAKSYTGARVALVGDAAHVVHPLAGQGLNLGFLDVAALADVLSGARKRGLDPGASGVLASYARWRQGDNAIAAHAFEGIDRLYRSSLPLLGDLRDAGFRIVDRLAPLKRRFVLHASGLAGRVPTWCRKPLAA